jgi:Transcriptional antiterminator
MDGKYLQILMILLEKEYVMTQEMSVTLRKTNRTIRNYLKDLNDVLNKQGATITNVYNKGHHLEVLDEEKFMSWLSKIQLPSVNYNHQEDRVIEIFNQLFFVEEYIKQQDIIDFLYISLKQLKEDLKIIKKILSQFHLKLVTKPYLGMKVEGYESDIRSCIAYIYYNYSQNFLRNNMDNFDNSVESMTEIIFSCIANKSFQISTDNLHQLVIYVVIALMRYQMNYKYQAIDKAIDETSVPFQIASNINMMIEKILGITLDQNETIYIAIGLLSKENKVLENNQEISEQIESIVMKMIQRVHDYYGISFVNEFDLLISLCLHVEPLLSRIRYRTFVHNPLTKDIKTNLYQSYEMATIACEVLNQRYHVLLPEDEISMIALHIDLAYERNVSQIYKKTILIVCSSGLGTARFLKARFEKQFHQFLNRIDVTNAIDIYSYDLSQYDCLFTTIDLSLDIQKPLIKIDNVIDARDYQKIETYLHNQVDLKKYIKEDLYFHKFECIDKTDCLKKMIDHMQKKYSLSHDFEKLVLHREELGSTEFGSVIALPHPIYPISSQSLLSIAILKKPILWNDNKIRIVILMSISSQQDMIELDEVYHIISTILSQKVLQNELIHSSTYEEVINSIRSYL